MQAEHSGRMAACRKLPTYVVRKFDWRRLTGIYNPTDPFETGCSSFRRISLTSNVEDYPLFAYSWYEHQWHSFCFTSVSCTRSAAGFVLGHVEGKHGHQGHVMALAVASDQQRSGTGTALMEELEESFKSNGARFL
jgi:GNAT superfamily N-acetyltransferase